MESKYCSRCRAAKPLDEFPRDRTRPDGYRYWCKACVRIDQNRPERRSRQRDREREKRYGVTPEMFQEMYAAQDARCGACHEPIAPTGNRTHIDHCHSTGLVRGLLCTDCNLALGRLKDDPIRIAGLLSYLGDHSG